VFEYLERRFGLLVSRIMLVAYIVFRCLYAGIVVYALSLVLHVVMGFPLKATIAGVSIGTLVYTSTGGIKGVIWTDVAQFTIMFGGIVVALVFAVRHVPGGFAEALDIAGRAGRLRWIDTDFDLTRRYVIWTLIPYGIVDFLGTKGIEQMNVQRFVSARSPFHAKMAMLVQSFFTMPFWLLLFSVGIALFAYYHHHPSPEVTRFIAARQYDRIFPHFIHSVMPAGLRGLMIAALLSAAMSTISSVFNVLSMLTTDRVCGLCAGWTGAPLSARARLATARCMTAAWGGLVTLAALAMIRIESILTVVNSIIGIFTGPMTGLFLLGMFSRRANAPGVLVGFAAAFATGLILQYRAHITFTLLGTTELIVMLAVGSVASHWFPPPDPSRIEPLLWRWHGWRAMLFGGVQGGETGPAGQPAAAGSGRGDSQDDRVPA
jgi:SSS family solute:Na+ symporter